MSDITLSGIDKKFNDKTVFSQMDLKIEKGKITAVLGESGCGKTTLLRMLSNLTEYSGKIENVPTSISYIFQENRLLPHYSALKNVMFVLNGDKAKMEEEAKAALTKANMTEFNLYPRELSGGMEKRVALARAIAKKAELILMDEPFSALDIKIKSNLIEEFKELIKIEKPTVVLVTHSPFEAKRLADNIAIIKDKKIGFFKKADETQEEEIINTLIN